MQTPAEIPLMRMAKRDPVSHELLKIAGQKVMHVYFQKFDLQYSLRAHQCMF